MLLAPLSLLVLPALAAKIRLIPVRFWGASIVLGLLESFFAIRGRHPVWAVVSAVWGFVAILVVFTLGTLFLGP